MTAHPPSDPAAEAVSALRETVERVAICRALGCIDKPGVPLKFVQDLQRRLAESWTRNGELIRSWDRASPTERQELDRMRRGWGPSSPTERARRRMDVAACVQALGCALTEISVPEEDADDVPEEAQAYLDAAHDRVEKAYKAAIAVSHAIRDEPDEWPDIKAAEERGALAITADRDRLATELAEARAENARLRASDTGRSEAEAKEAAEKVCHDEQMTVWSGEVIGRLTEYLRDDLSYDDVLHANDAVAREIRSIVESAFGHPELAGRAAINPPAGDGGLNADR